MQDQSLAVPSGALAPQFRLPVATGGTLGLEEFRGRAHVVLVFLRNRR